MASVCCQSLARRLLTNRCYGTLPPSVVVGDERNALPKLPRLSFVQIILVATAVVIGYFAFAAVGDTLLSLRVNQDEQELRQEVAQLRQDQAQLESIREYLWTDEYVEGVARRMLGLVRVGESLVIVSPSGTATPAAEEEPTANANRRWWERLYIP